MYYEDLMESAVNDESSTDFRNRQKQAVDAVKKLDKYYEKFTVPFNDYWIDGKHHKYLTVENYGSGSQGTLIRNAVTGVRYNIHVGSANEDILFKVADSTGRDGRKEPLMLFYDSPEQFENHHFTTLSPEVKQKWYQRSLEAQKRFSE